MALFTLAFMGMFGLMFFAIANAPAERGTPPPPAFFLIFWLFFVAFYAALTIPSFIAGYALLKRKRWAKIAAIIGGVIAAMFFPIGTAVCVYTFWFLFSEPGKLLYDTPDHTLPPPPLFGASRESSSQPEFQHHSSPTPPDWR
jgi:hypothetical protein